jgi:cell division septum initiation protein DivIVA
MNSNICGKTTPPRGRSQLVIIIKEKRRASSVALALAITALVSAGAGVAQTAKVNSVISEQVKTEEAAKASQKKVEALDEEATKMLADYRQMLAETTSLKAYNEQLATQVKSQDEQVAEMTAQLTTIESTSKEVLPMMDKMLATLDQFVKLDVPFLIEERTNRVAQLKDMMSRADVSTSEKYRRIVEAYQIEMEYGRTIEAYQGKVGDKTVDFLRAGRVSLMYQTLDGKETGFWDATEKAFKKDNDYADALRAGLKVAKKQAAPDFVRVAVSAPKEIS